MSGVRASNLCRASIQQCYTSKPPPLFPSSFPPLPQAGCSRSNFSARSSRSGFGKCANLGQIVWSRQGDSVAPRTSFAFYSDCPSVKREESKGPVGAMTVVSKESLLQEIEHMLGSPLGRGPQAPQSKPLVLVISGPSGVGKDAVINRLKEVRDEIRFVVTATTRTKRPGEVHGKDYFFVKREEFEAMIQKEELLEHAVVYGDFKGIPKRQVRECLSRGLDCVLRVDVQGAATIRSIMGSGAVLIFLVAESEAALVRRLVERKTETKEKLLLRITTAREELGRMNEFDYIVVNVDGQLERTVSLISNIIDAEKARVHQREASL